MVPPREGTVGWCRHAPGRSSIEPMFRALRQRASAIRPDQVAIAVLAGVFLLSMEGLVPEPARAGSSTSQMADTRRNQNRALFTMRSADLKIKSLKKTKKQSRKRAGVAAKRFRKQSHRRDRVLRQLVGAEERLELATLDRDRKLRVHPNPSGAQFSDKPALRKRVATLRSKVKRIDRKVDRLQRKASRSRKVARTKSQAIGRIKNRIERKTARRERAEASLGAAIQRMIELAQARAASHTTARPAATGFRRPARGRISQGYGRSHDGIDIATARGARVRASATGYVAFVGWNPWDKGKRAFIVVIGHAGGFETIYAHLLPIRVVRAGQLVNRGQVIGRAGSTGHSTGPHVHWEVSRGFRTMDPRSVGR